MLSPSDRGNTQMFHWRSAEAGAGPVNKQPASDGGKDISPSDLAVKTQLRFLEWARSFRSMSRRSSYQGLPERVDRVSQFLLVFLK